MGVLCEVPYYVKSIHSLSRICYLNAIGIAPPLLVYADLIASGDDRNIEAAEIIYDNYLAHPDWQDR